MLDHPSDTPAARPPKSFLIALTGASHIRTDAVGAEHGLPAEANGSGGYHVGRATLVRVNGNPPLTWAKFVEAHAHLERVVLRDIFADLSARGSHAALGATLEIAVVADLTRPAPSPERLTADARLARLDAAYAQLREIRRRYVDDTSCNAWTIEQALRDVALTAMKAAEAMAIRAEAA